MNCAYPLPERPSTDPALARVPASRAILPCVDEEPARANTGEDAVAVTIFAMKIGFIVLGMLTMASTFWWATRRHTQSRLGWRDKKRIALQSLLAGIAVYFVLLLGAALYLAITNS